MFRKQTGLGLIGFIFFVGLAMLSFNVVTKLGPAYFENYVINQIVKKMVNEQASNDKKRIQELFDNQAMMEGIVSVTSKDLEIIFDSSGNFTLGIEYERVIPLTETLAFLTSFKIDPEFK